MDSPYLVFYVNANSEPLSENIRLVFVDIGKLNANTIKKVPLDEELLIIYMIYKSKHLSNK